MATEEYSTGYEEGRQDGWNAAMESLPAQREPLTRCCNHDSDCAIHGGDDLANAACDCSQLIVSSPDFKSVAETAYKLAKNELGRLVNENFGRLPSGDAWVDKVLLVRDSFDYGIKENT